MSARCYDPFETAKEVLPSHTQYPLPFVCGWLDCATFVCITSLGVQRARSGNNNYDGLVAAGNEIGMGLFWHYCGASPYEYYYTDVRITPQSLALERSPNVSRVVLIVYLNWVNSVAYQVPIAYVTPLTLAVNTLGCLFQVILTLDAYRIKNHIQVSDATSRSARKQVLTSYVDV